MKLSYRRPVMMVADGVNDAPALPWPISAPRWEGGAAASAEAA
jgi:high-affinity K+ transport system ATPase subunit B